MKTKFGINQYVFKGRTLEEAIKYHEEYLKPKGWNLDAENEDVYIIYDKHIKLKEGDRIYLDSYMLVTWKCYYVEEDIVEYILEEE